MDSSLDEGIYNGQAAFNCLPILHIFAEQGHTARVNCCSNNQAVPVTERISFSQKTLAGISFFPA
jgi:hypothetical protein